MVNVIKEVKRNSSNSNEKHVECFFVEEEENIM
jgi:hypothetical protein